MKTQNCPECKKGLLGTKQGDYETVYTDREGMTHSLIVPSMTWQECETCGEVTLDNSAMLRIDQARRKAMGLLAALEIRDFRLRLGMTQEAMSVLLGIGEKTYCRWESGAYVQSEASDRYLRLLLLNEANIDLLEQISQAKKEPDGQVQEAFEIFSYLTDVASLKHRARVFTELMARGELQAA